MTNISIKSQDITHFGGIFHAMEKFDCYIGTVIDGELGLRCTTVGYQYSEILRSQMNVYFCGGDCVGDVTSPLMPHLSLHPTLRTCSSDTILRGIKELSTANTTYTSETGRSYDFNTAAKMNGLLVRILVSTGQLMVLSTKKGGLHISHICHTKNTENGHEHENVSSTQPYWHLNHEGG